MCKRPLITATCYDKQGRILSVRQNSFTKTHPFQKYLAVKVGHPKKEYLHAEIAAILACKTKLIHKIKVERYNSTGKAMNAKPCTICQLAISMFNISLIEYTQ